MILQECYYQEESKYVTAFLVEPFSVCWAGRGSCYVVCVGCPGQGADGANTETDVWFRIFSQCRHTNKWKSLDVGLEQMRSAG